MAKCSIFQRFWMREAAARAYVIEIRPTSMVKAPVQSARSLELRLTSARVWSRADTCTRTMLSRLMPTGMKKYALQVAYVAVRPDVAMLMQKLRGADALHMPRAMFLCVPGEHLMLIKEKRAGWSTAMPIPCMALQGMTTAGELATAPTMLQAKTIEAPARKTVWSR